MATTPQGSLRYPTSGNSTNVPQDIQNLATDLDSKILNRYTTTTARDAAITSPASGQMAIAAEKPYLRVSGAWRGLPKAAAGGIFSGTLNATGDVNITHGLGLTPTFADFILIGTTGAAQYGNPKHYQAADSTNLFLRVSDTRDGTNMGNWPINIYWFAIVL